jgi:hypothetical protein
MPMPRGGSTSPLANYAQQILTLNRARPDLSLDEIFLALHKRRIPGSRRALSRFFARHGITVKRGLRAAERKRADAGSATKGRLSPLTLYLSTKLLSLPTCSWSIDRLSSESILGNML